MTLVFDRNQSKYLSQIERGRIEPIPPKIDFYAAAVIIPVFCEFDYLGATLASLAKSCAECDKPIMVLLVVNNMLSASEGAKADNMRLLAALRSSNPEICGGLEPGRNLFWIDRASTGCELIKGGVGRARKIGFDNVIESVRREDGILLSLDADTLLEDNYLSEAIRFFAENNDCAGAIIDFSHQLPESPPEREAVIAYENYIKDYYKKLLYAKSPYAFWALGSAIGVSWQEYIRCGGMRIREAGEDFYFLQALSKIGTIGVINSTKVYPSGRFSDRVPFGTGRKVEALVNKSEQIELFPWSGFEQLRRIFSVLEEHNSPEFFDKLPEYFDTSAGVEFTKFLSDNNFSSAWSRIVKNTPRNATALRRAFHWWFDGLKTLQYLHSLENKKN